MYEKFKDQKSKRDLYLDLSKRLGELRTEREKIQEKINNFLSVERHSDGNEEKNKMEKIDKEISDLKYQKDLVDEELMFMKSSVVEVDEPHGLKELSKTKEKLEEILFFVEKELKNWSEHDKISQTYHNRQKSIKDVIKNKAEEIQMELDDVRHGEKIKSLEQTLDKYDIGNDYEKMFVFMVKNLDKFKILTDVTVVINKESTRKLLIDFDCEITEE
jgi:hypothetical protein